MSSMKQLGEAASIGADLSPGDPVAKWAVTRIKQLESMLRFWADDSRLQSFESRERFRKEVAQRVPPL